MKKLRLLTEASIHSGTRVILRADFDVPLGRGVGNELRVREMLPTIRYILKKGGHLRIIAHAGRPQGRWNSALSLSPIVRFLSRTLHRSAILIDDSFDAKVFRRYQNSSEVLVFENLRFWPGEEKNDIVFARKLARWGDIYVNDAFGNSHRQHGSMVALPRLLPSYAGFQCAEEVRFLENAARHASRQTVICIGGAKLETKIPVIISFLKKGATVLVGGAPANTFFDVKKTPIGKSSAEKKFVKVAGGLLRRYPKNIILPLDVIIGKGVGFRTRHIKIGERIANNEQILDIGQETIRNFQTYLRHAKTIIWNGPMGIAEEFSEGTRALARAIIRQHAFTVVGGGDTVSFLRKHKLLHGFTYVSAGGGALLEFFAGKKLPGIEVLRK